MIDLEVVIYLKNAGSYRFHGVQKIEQNLADGTLRITEEHGVKASHHIFRAKEIIGMQCEVRR